jgi:hypothetical protein
MNDRYYVPYYEPLSNDDMWVKMVLLLFKSSVDLSNPESFFERQFNVRKDESDQIYFYEKCKEHLINVRNIYEDIVDNNCQLPDSPTLLEKQVFNCDSIFGYNQYDHAARFNDNKIPLIRLTHFNNVINALEELIVNSKKVVFSNKSTSQYNSFKLKNLNTQFSKLTDLKRSLINKNYIHPETLLLEFRKVFSGEVIVNKIIWTGTISDLYYFIQQLYTRLQLVEDLKQNHWAVAASCFVDSEGNSYDRNKLKESKATLKTKNIDDALKTLK